jgi:6-phosphogluconolactonase (cycloisomerase 2 family)
MLKKAAALVLVCASVGICVSCGGITEGRLLYAAIPTSNELVVYREDPNSGALTQLVGSPIAAGPGVRALALHPNQKFLYAANSGENDVSVFKVAISGSLTEQTPRTPVGTAPTLLAMDPTGSYLYVGNTGQQPSISVFSINTDGTLKPVPQPPSTGNTAYIGLTPINMAVSSNNVLYVTGQGLQGYVVAFPLTNGVLGTPPAGSPYLAGNNPYGLAISSNGSNLYTANKLDNSVSEFSIGSGGALSALHGSPVSISFIGPTALLIDPSEKYLFAADQGSTNLEGFTIGSDGSLNLLASAPFATKNAPSALACDSAGRYVFVAGQSTPGSIQSFFLSRGNGTLTLISSYSVAPGAPTSMVLTK